MIFMSVVSVILPFQECGKNRKGAKEMFLIPGRFRSLLACLLRWLDLKSCISDSKMKYSGRSVNGHSRKRTAVLTTAFDTNPRLNSHTNSVFTHSRKRPRILSAGYDLDFSFVFKFP